jgi:hypothetical protein
LATGNGVAALNNINKIRTKQIQKKFNACASERNESGNLSLV